MRRLLDALKLLWAVGCTVLGLWLGAELGYVNGGWIGAICLGFTGALIGAFVGAGGPTFLLQILR